MDSICASSLRRISTALFELPVYLELNVWLQSQDKASSISLAPKTTSRWLVSIVNDKRQFFPSVAQTQQTPTDHSSISMVVDSKMYCKRMFRMSPALEVDKETSRIGPLLFNIDRRSQEVCVTRSVYVVADIKYS